MSIWNNGVGLSIFGESHGEYIGITLSDIPHGYLISQEALQNTINRRKAHMDMTSSASIEPDIPQIISGIYGGYTTGAPITILVKNTCDNSTNSDDFCDIPCPSKADLTAQMKYHGYQDKRGDGHFSERITVALVAGGGICEQILAQNEIAVACHVLKVGDFCDTKFDKSNLNIKTFNRLNNEDFMLIDNTRILDLIQTVQEIRNQQNSVGSIVECAAIGVPSGLGAPYFENLKATISSLIFSIPGVMGLSFGDGFSSVNMFGSQFNDQITIKRSKICCASNHSGGIQGGISNEMPITTSVCFKPTPSIETPQQTYSFVDKTKQTIYATGEHDTCIGIRGCAVVHACMDIAILSQIVKYRRELL